MKGKNIFCYSNLSGCCLFVDSFTLLTLLSFCFFHSAPCYPGLSRKPGTWAGSHSQSAVLRWGHPRPTTLMAEERHGHHHKTLQTTHTSRYKQILVHNSPIQEAFSLLKKEIFGTKMQFHCQMVFIDYFNNKYVYTDFLEVTLSIHYRSNVCGSSNTVCSFIFVTQDHKTSHKGQFIWKMNK